MRNIVPSLQLRDRALGQLACRLKTEKSDPLRTFRAALGHQVEGKKASHVVLGLVLCQNHYLPLVHLEQWYVLRGKGPNPPSLFEVGGLQRPHC